MFTYHATRWQMSTKVMDSLSSNLRRMLTIQLRFFTWSSYLENPSRWTRLLKIREPRKLVQTFSLEIFMRMLMRKCLGMFSVLLVSCSQPKLWEILRVEFQRDMVSSAMTTLIALTLPFSQWMGNIYAESLLMSAMHTKRILRQARNMEV